MAKDNYTINIDFSASYGDDKENAGVTCSVRDSDGLNVSTHKKIDGEDIDSALAEMFDDVIGSIVASKATKPASKEEELQAKLDSMAIDNKVLQARLDKLQKAYDVLAKKTPWMDHTPNTYKCNDDNVKRDKPCNCNCNKTTVNVRPGDRQYIPINVRTNTKNATLDDLESYVDKLYKDAFKRFVE